ncbi:cytochrome c oxidase assembly protein [Legionella beliardensis]|uniref:Cytochrome c oxidase assembly protein n=1 Tax=Legionella beliardensis TaxID=91822 RepID=A0A378I082_9GAMM|nr:COX15/CtaA family protein [Legionella beliardensis]STX28120.1 cytochrome c oxidase assembly protein [Legionella beliardensis]
MFKEITKLQRYAVTLAAILALIVVMLGAFTRLTNAGLGCPDWPGCYGHLVLPSNEKALTAAQLQYPQNPIEASKAWTEMAHRYAAGLLALLIFSIGFYNLKLWYDNNAETKALPIVLMLLVLFQAALGMWTVTLKLLPIVVMAHLLGGMVIFSLLLCLRMQLTQVKAPVKRFPKWQFWVGLGVVLVFCQIALGGWVSANYAGIACIGFPQCNGSWLPPLHLSEGFYLFSPVGANYQGGLLENEIRVTIQFIHRLGALIVTLYMLSLATFLLLKIRDKAIRITATLVILLVFVQVTLGILNVIYLLPLSIAVAHNGIAALLLATSLSLLYFTQRRVSDVS